LSLASAAAPSVLRYRIKASAGLSARLSNDGGVRFTDATGRARFGFAPPTATDAKGRSGSASFVLEPSRDGWTLTLTVDRRWLHARGRAFPVSIDPDVTWMPDGALRFTGADVDCSTDKATPTTSNCDSPSLFVGGTGGNKEKALA